MFISMINFLGIAVNPVTGILRSIGAIFCSFIYWFVVRLFNLFIKIAELDILSSTSIEGMYQRITMILTIVMTFYITFEFIKYVVSPDTITDKEKGAGGLIKRIFVVIVLIAFVPTIFSGAYKLQNKVIETQVFSKIILGQEVFDYSSYGSSFAADALGTFYKVDYDKCGDNCDKAEKEVKDNLEKIRQEGGTIYLGDKINMCGENVEGTGTLICRPAIDFNGVWGIIFGVFICYVLVMYCIDVGTRYAQLLFLQLISPIAIISYISPKKDGTFQKWIKQCISTYLDLFIRIAIIYFVLVIIRTLGDALKISELTSNGDDVGLLVYAFLVMGLMVFAQKAPKMLQELLPSTGGAASIGYGFGAKERFEPIKKSWQTIKSPYDVSKKAAASIYGGASALKAMKGKHGLLNKNADKPASRKERMKQWATTGYSGMKAVAKGVKTGAKDGNFQKAANAGRQSIQDDLDIRESGGNVLDANFKSAKAAELAKEQDRKIRRLQKAGKAKDNIENATDDIGGVKALKKYYEAATNSDVPKEIQDMRLTTYKNGRKAVIYGKEVTEQKDITYGTYTVDDKGNRTYYYKDEEKYASVYKDSYDKKKVELIREKRLAGKELSVAMEEAETEAKIFAEGIAEKNCLGSFIVKSEDKAEIDRVEIIIKDERSTAISDEAISELTIKVDGKTDKKVKDLTDEEYRKNYGLIAKEANAAIEEEQRKDEYTEAHANAKGASGGSNS